MNGFPPFLNNFSNNTNELLNVICKANVDSDKIHCGNIVKEICTKCEGNGGGNKLFAQGGGSNAKSITKYLTELKNDLKNSNNQFEHISYGASNRNRTGIFQSEFERSTNELTCLWTTRCTLPIPVFWTRPRIRSPVRLADSLLSFRPFLSV